jgi:hypothetical protein
VTKIGDLIVDFLREFEAIFKKVNPCIRGLGGVDEKNQRSKISGQGPFHKASSHFEKCFSSLDSNLFMLTSGHWTNSKGPPKQQPIEILQCERIGAPDSNVSYAPISALWTPVAVWHERSGF